MHEQRKRGVSEERDRREIAIDIVGQFFVERGGRDDMPDGAKQNGVAVRNGAHSEIDANGSCSAGTIVDKENLL